MILILLLYEMKNFRKFKKCIKHLYIATFQLPEHKEYLKAIYDNLRNKTIHLINFKRCCDLKMIILWYRILCIFCFRLNV